MGALVPEKLEMLEVSSLMKAKTNARTHSKAQVAQLAKQISRYGFLVPIVIDEANVIMGGHGRLEAAKLLQLSRVPCVRRGDLTEDEKRAYALADNAVALKAGWDKAILAQELRELVANEYIIEDTGFDLIEVDQILSEDDEAAVRPTLKEDRHVEPESSASAISRLGDVWELGGHRLVNGDAKDPEVLRALMAGEEAAMVFSDPPYNVKITGHVCGKGRIQHREFAEASGEMSREQFVGFLKAAIGPAADACKEGGILQLCMDDRHLEELLEAGRSCNLQLMRICVWAKTNAGMGTFYRSQTEFVTVWKVGKAPHTNTFGLGDLGRSRTTLWTYAGVNTFKADRLEELAMHPTVKPTALVADAIRDVSHRGEIVLDMFAGSGTTLIAAQKTGRLARLIEIDALYCDAIIERWQKFTGKTAVLAETGEDFETVAQRRRNVGWELVAAPVQPSPASAQEIPSW